MQSLCNAACCIPHLPLQGATAALGDDTASIHTVGFGAVVDMLGDWMPKFEMVEFLETEAREIKKGQQQWVKKGQQ